MHDGLPPAFLERLRAIVPPERYDAVLKTFSDAPATGFRVNTLKAEADAVRRELAEAGIAVQPVGWKADAFTVAPEARAALLASAAYVEQRVYVQNLSSMIPPLVLGPKPGERVLDLAAAPGSKTLQIACEMENEGEIAAVELVRGRFFKMQANLKAQGATAVRTFLKNGETVWRNRPEYFDRVLLDAPCSTEGRFHTSDPETYAYWSLRKVREMTRKQHRLLFSAVQCLRVGGVLVYATCAFAPEENEAVLDDTLRRFGDAVQLEPLGLELDNMLPPLQEWQGRRYEADLSYARRVLPTPTMEGFFVAKLRKLASTL